MSESGGTPRKDPFSKPTIGGGRPNPSAGQRPAGQRVPARPGARPGQADPRTTGGKPTIGGAPRTPVTRPAGSQSGPVMARPTGPRTTSGRPGQAGGRRAPRRVRLGVARIDPWSAMKVSFLLSVALGIASVVAVMVLWLVLNQMGVLQSLNQMVQDITAGEGNKSAFDLMKYFGFGRVVSVTIVISVADMLILTALSTLAAFLYNTCASLVGGVQLTLTDE